MPVATLNRDFLYTPSEKAGEPPSKNRPSSFSNCITTPAFALVTGILLLLIAGCSESSKPKVETTTSQIDQISNQPEEENHSLASKMAIETEPKAEAQPVPKPESSEEPVSKPVPDLKNTSVTDKKTEKLYQVSLQIIKIDPNVEKSIKESNEFINIMNQTIQMTLHYLLKTSNVGYLENSIIVDLSKKQILLELNQEPPKNLADIINKIPDQLITVSNIYKFTTTELKSKQSAALTTEQKEVDFRIIHFDFSFEQRLKIDFDSAKKNLLHELEFHFRKKLPEYIPNTIKVILDERPILRFQLNQLPADTLGIRINNLTIIPIKISDRPIAVRDAKKSLKSPVENSLRQVTYQIMDMRDFEKKSMKHSYNFWRSNLEGDFTEIMLERVPGYIPDSLDINFTKMTVTFQLNHTPAVDLGKRLSNLNSAPLTLSDKPLAVGPAAPPFQTPDRPMNLVTLKIIGVRDFGDNYSTDKAPLSVKKVLAHQRDFNNHESYNRLLRLNVSSYIEDSVRIDIANLLLSFQIDRNVPDDLATQINDNKKDADLTVGDEIVSIQKVEYDPESSEKTIFFQFVDKRQKQFQSQNVRERRNANMNLKHLPRYIHNSLNIDFDQGTLNFKVRVGGNEKTEIKDAIDALSALKLNATYLHTKLPQGNGRSNPTGIGIVSGESNMAASATNSRSTTNSPTGTTNVPVGQNVVVTVQYGLYGGRKKPKTSAFDVIKGFSWIDGKSLKVDTAKKEFTFKTTGPYNGGAIERALKRNKFYKCNVTHEAVTDETEAQK